MDNGILGIITASVISVSTVIGLGVNIGLKSLHYQSAKLMASEWKELAEQRGKRVDDLEGRVKTLESQVTMLVSENEMLRRMLHVDPLGLVDPTTRLPIKS